MVEISYEVEFEVLDCTTRDDAIATAIARFCNTKGGNLFNPNSGQENRRVSVNGVKSTSAGPTSVTFRVTTKIDGNISADRFCEEIDRHFDEHSRVIDYHEIR